MTELFALILFIFLMYQLMKYLFRILFGISRTSSRSRSILSDLTMMPLYRVFNLFNLTSSKGLMSKSEASTFLSSLNKGLVLDGKDRRLSQKESFNHMAIIARSGGGKTSSYIIPNILKLASANNSMVITDLSGELYQLTSGYLHKKGFKVYVLDPEDLEASIYYNPLYYALSSIEIDEIAEILVRSANPGQIKAGDKMWLDGAKTLLSILIKVLLATNDHRFINLANLKHLINNFGPDGRSLDELIFHYADTKTFNEWKGFVSGNPKTVQSFVSTANIALNAIGINDNLAALTSNHTVDLKAFKREKSILYIRIPAQKQEQYSFLLNLFYKQFFNAMMERLPSKQELPVYCLLDEFGNMQIPGFSSTITTIRKYRVSISIVIQNFSQLEEKYGRHESQSILSGGISGKLFYSGADLEISSMLSKMIGERYVNRLDDFGQMHHVKEPILSNSDIRTMKDDEALLIYGNKLPLKMRTKPYYKDFLLRSHTKYPPANAKGSKAIVSEIEYIDIDPET